MLLDPLDATDPTPLHRQVAVAIRRAIADGRYEPGDRLPTARDIARALRVNPNTVLRALRALRDEQLLEFRRGRGVTVAAHAVPRSAVIEQLDLLVRVARANGVTRAELTRMLEEYT